MKRSGRLWLLVAFGVLFTCAALGESIGFLAPDSIAPGMRGKGRTVFAGGKIEEFEVEFLGVHKNAFPKRDLILASLRGAPLDKTGVIAGMSGSPIYVDDLLVGAIAYTWSFAKEPLVGIVPIGEMVSLLSAGEGPGATSGGTEPLRHEASAAGGADFKPVAVPVGLSGLLPASVQALGGLWSRWGAVPVQMGSVSQTQAQEFKLEPGACVGVALIRGDISMIAVGTLTYLGDGKFVAFGHQFAGVGPTTLPLVAGYVHMVVPRQELSYRIAGDGGVIGKVSQDRASGIAGSIGSDVKMVPASVRIRAAGGQETEYHCEIADDPYWHADLIEALALNALVEAERRAGEATVRASLEMDIGGPTSFTFGNIFYSAGRPPDQVAAMMRTVRELLANPFELVRIRRVAIEVSVSDRRETARIEQVVASKPAYRPGESVTLSITLAPHSGPSVVEKMEFVVPDDAVPGSELQVDVCDARVNEELAERRSPGVREPTSLEQYLDLLKRRPHNGTLCGRVLVQRTGLSIEGASFPSLPGSLLPVLGARVRSGVTQMSGEITLGIETPWFLSGSQTIMLRVARQGDIP